MPTIYRTQKITRGERRVLLFLLVFPFLNYGLRLFHLRLGLVPFEDQLRASTSASDADFNLAMSWLEFGWIFVFSHLVIILVVFWILLREVVWRLWSRPTTKLVSVRNLFLIVGATVITFISVFLFLSPDAAAGTGFAGPRVFTGAMTAGGVALSHMLVLAFLMRPQQVDQIFRINRREQR